jgi:DNA polymerase-1
MSSPRRWKKKQEVKSKKTDPVSSLCSTCPIAERCGGCYRIYPDIPKSKEFKYLFMGESPMPPEIEADSPFKGPAGSVFRDALVRGEFRPEEYALTNACWCPARIAEQDYVQQPTYEEARHCIAHSLALVQNFRPRVIVAVGAPACKSLTGDKKFKVGKEHGKWLKINVPFEALYATFRLWFKNQRVRAEVLNLGDPDAKLFYYTELNPVEQEAECWEQIHRAEKDLGYSLDWLDTPVMPVYHPSFILHKGRWGQLWEELCLDLTKARDEVEGIVRVKEEVAYRWIETIDDWIQYVDETIKMHEDGKLPIFACDTETTMQQDVVGHLPYDPNTRLVAFSASRRANEGIAVMVNGRDHGFNDPTEFGMFRHHLDRLLTTVPSVWQNATFDYNILRCLLGIKPKVAADTMLMDHWYNMGQGLYHGLDELGQRYAGTGKHKSEAKDWFRNNPGKTFDDMPRDILLEYAAGDADVTLKCYWKIRKEIEGEGRWTQHQEHYWGVHKGWQVIADLEWHGMAIDKKQLDRLAEVYPQRLQEVIVQLHKTRPVMRFLSAKYGVYREGLEQRNAEVAAARAAGNKRRRPSKIKTMQEWLQDKKNQFNPASDKQVPLLWSSLGIPFDHRDLKDLEFSDKCPRCKKEWCRCEPKYKPKNPRANAHNRDVLGPALRDWAVKSEKAGNPNFETWKMIADTTDLISRFKKLQKLNGTYVQGIYKVIPDKDETGADPRDRCFHLYRGCCDFPPSWTLHPSFNMHGTDTGRLSSSDPNGQNFPGKGDTKDTNIKRPYISRWYGKGGLLVQPDYSQIEVRVMVVECGDERLAAAINAGKDIHKFVTSLVHDIPEEEVTADLRKPCKTVTFGILYGQGTDSIAQALHITRKEAEDLQKRFFAMLPKVKGFVDAQHKFVRENQYVATRLGRIRYLTHIASERVAKSNKALRDCVNTPIQSIASDLCWRAYGRTWERIKEIGILAHPFSIIHDSSTFDVGPGHFFDLIELQYYEMVHRTQELFPWLNVKPEADFSIGTQWSGLIDVKLFFDDEDWGHYKLGLDGPIEDVDEVHAAIITGGQKVTETGVDGPHPQPEEAEKGKWYREVIVDRPNPLCMLNGKKLDIMARS